MTPPRPPSRPGVRRKRLLLGAFLVLGAGGVAASTLGRDWADRHARQHARPGEPMETSCLKCHAGGAPRGAVRTDRPTPTDLAVAPDGKRAYVVLAPQRRVVVLDPARAVVVGEIDVPGRPGGLALSADGARLAVTLEDRHEVLVVATATRREVSRHAVGTEPAGVAFSADGRRLFVANAGSDDVAIVDLAGGATVRRPGGREPFAVARSPDGATIAVMARRADLAAPDAVPSSELTLLDGASGEVRRRVALPSIHMAEAIAFTPDSARLLVPAIEVRNLVPILQVDRAWAIGGVLCAVDVATGAVAVGSLAEPTRGFSDPTGVAVSPDGRVAVVLASGTDEAAFLDLPAYVEAVRDAPPDGPRALGLARRYVVERVAVGRNPRGVAFAGGRVLVTERLADAVAVLDALGTHRGAVVGRVVLDASEPDALRRGERVFHDGRQAFQGHFSCRSCHPGAHTDGLTYDFEVDGLGRNRVLNRSLRGIAGTEPFKWVGSNATLEKQCGPRFAMVLSRADLFTDAQLSDLVAWMHSLPAPPPRPGAGSVTGVDRDAVERGRKLFHRVARKDGRAIPPAGRCVTCHAGPQGTNRARADVGTKGPHDATGRFDVPHLTGIATKAPYLHDGRALTLEEIWTLPGVHDQHGVVTDLTKAELNDLIEYLRSL